VVATVRLMQRVVCVSVVSDVVVNVSNNTFCSNGYHTVQLYFALEDGIRTKRERWVFDFAVANVSLSLRHNASFREYKLKATYDACRFLHKHSTSHTLHSVL